MILNLETKTKIQSQKIKNILNFIIEQLLSHKYSKEFSFPIDYVSQNILDYPLIIKTPMDLGTIKQKLSLSNYKTIQSFLKDIQLVWSNCIAYNPPHHWIIKQAKELKSFCRRLIKNYLPQININYRQNKQNKNQQGNHPPTKIQQDQIIETTQTQKRQGEYQTDDKWPVKVKQQQSRCYQNVQLQTLIQPIQEEKYIQRIQSPFQTIPQPNQPQSQSQTLKNNLPLIQTLQDSNINKQNIDQKQQFIKLIKNCNEKQAQLMFITLRNRCQSSIKYDKDGYATIDVQKLDQETMIIILQHLLECQMENQHFGQDCNPFFMREESSKEIQQESK